jgi:sugar lactone lactonase YvrE
MRAEQLTDPIAYHGEGPVWCERWGGLRCVDMLAGDVLTLSNSGAVKRRHVGAIAAALRPRRDGGAVIGVERGFALERADGTVEPLPPLWKSGDVRMNDGSCDPDGRFYCGSMAYDTHPGGGALYRLDPDGSMHPVLEHATVSNGIEWSPDGERAYYVDSATQRIDVFDYDRDAGLTGRRTFAAIAPEAGIPDGLTVDSAGGVWVAIFGGGAVLRYRRDGALDGMIEVPARQVTACTFGGPALDQLIITTSRQNLDLGVDPLAGALFRAAVGVPGQPAREFAG